MEINNSFLVGLGEWGNSYNAASTPPVYSECAISVVSPCLPYFHHGSKKGRWGWRIRQVWDQFSSVAQSCPTFCDPMDCSMRGFPVHHQLLEPTQTHIHYVGDAIQPSHPVIPFSPAFYLSQHQGLFQGVSSSYQVAKVLELQHQSFQWIFRTDFL